MNEGLSRGALRLLANLCEVTLEGEYVTLDETADGTALAVRLDRLAARGLVETEPPGWFRRYRLTAAGRAVARLAGAAEAEP